MTNLFIVFEGIDGSGTTTQAELLKEYFIAKGKPTVISPEPTNRPIGQLIRQLLQKKVILTEDPQKFDEQMAYLFAADRYDHLYNEFDGVFKLLTDNYNVISTRYYFSSLAYHCSQPKDWDLVTSLNQRFPQPHLVVYLELPIQVALDRLKNRSLREIYEHQDKLTKVKKNYAEILANYSGVKLQLSGQDKPEKIHGTIVNFIEKNLNEH